MVCRSSVVVAIILSAVVCLGAPRVLAQPLATVCIFDFEDSSQYGIPDDVCVNNPIPPLFNRPGYGPETAAYIAPPAACGEGILYGSFGSDSLLTAVINWTNSNTLRFSWVNPTDNRIWLRLPAHSTAEQAVLNPSPTVHLGVGSSIEMKVTIYGFDASELENPSAQLEFALCIRETGKRLPLGEDGGMIGDVEFVGITAKGFGSDADTPIGGVTVNHNAMLEGWTTLKWTFIDDGAGGVGVEVSVDGGAPVQKDIVGFTGNGVLSATYNRGTLDSLAIRKPEADTTTKKWRVWIDDIVIDAPGIAVEPDCNDPPQDADGDGDVDLADFGLFSACFNGPNRPWSPTVQDQQACWCLDQDDDGDVDLADFGMFSACFNGPNRPPACE